MNKLIATVANIQKCDSLHIVKFDFCGQTFAMMSLELNETIQIGTKVSLVVKPTHIALGKNVDGELSYSNQLKCVITSIENGQLLSSVKLAFFDTTLESIITVNSSKKMNLQVGDTVTAFIKASDLSIGKVVL
ncbi:hypothetical protein ALC152_19370 [Arcobacter sp. 15-2]|uniref:TOBE domain-containing protein n=1 Tax=Arcobacter sp. 15-2 TaxID=3374109 RepID=UPI00399C4EC3